MTPNCTHPCLRGIKRRAGRAEGAEALVNENSRLEEGGHHDGD
jgi:hypothetical protein